ncbi:hypothetical protein Tco_0954832 [Tanacetum coccineum]|uniref:Retrotransposon gag domain-containing protein n=1 Tax=Tanacetum coccineum TaxID=301880 RepID=A0ABQ5E5I7_9ASTR
MNLRVSFLHDSEEGTTEVLQCKLPPKEQNPRNFTLPCTIGEFNFYAMADLGASVNVMPKVKKALLKSWVIDCFEEALDPDKDPRERSFDDYKWIFDLEIEQLTDEYELGIGKKGHMLEMIWENCKNIQDKVELLAILVQCCALLRLHILVTFVKIGFVELVKNLILKLMETNERQPSWIQFRLWSWVLGLLFAGLSYLGGSCCEMKVLDGLTKMTSLDVATSRGGLLGYLDIFYIGTMTGVDINALTTEQYLALSRENQAPGVVKPEIEGNVNFEIKSQFIRELREETFFRNKNEDAHDHVDQVLNIVSLFNIPRVTQDAVLLRVFPFTLTGTAKRWVDRLTPGTVNTWDLFKKAFIQRYCPPSKTAKRLEDIHNFKQESDESLYQALEWFNDLLYKCPTHDINIHQKVNIFYKGLNTMNHQLLDSQGPIPGMTPTHLDKECPLNEEVKQVEEAKYREFGHPAPFNGSNEAKYRVGPPGFYTRIVNRPPYGETRPSLEELMNNYQEESVWRSTEMNE